MSTKTIADGGIVTLTAPSGGVTSGATKKIVGLIGIVQNTAAEGDLFGLAVRGVHSVTKVGSEAWAEGDPVYWDDSNSRWTKTVADNLILAGYATEVVGSGAGATTGKVLLAPELRTVAAGTFAFSAGSNLVGVDGTGSNAAPLAGTETRLDAIDTALVAIRAILVENGFIPNA